MMRKLHSLVYDIDMKKVIRFSIHLDKQTDEKFRSVFSLEDYEPARTTYYIGTFKTLRAMKAYFDLIGENPTTSLDRFLRLVTVEGKSPISLISEGVEVSITDTLPNPQCLILRNDKVLAVGLVGITIPVNLYVKLSEKWEYDLVVEKDDKGYNPIPTFRNLLDENGNFISDKPEFNGEITTSNGEVFLGTVEFVRLMGYGGGPAMSFAPTYSGLFESYMVTQQLMKIKAVQPSVQSTGGNDVTIIAGKVIYFATDSLMVMY